MANPIFTLFPALQVAPAEWTEKEVDAANATNGKIALAAVAFDFVTIPTLLFIGILGALSVITLPIAGSYAMIGIATAGVLLWVAKIVKESSNNTSNYDQV